MKTVILSSDIDKDLIDRLMDIRNIADDRDTFLDPSYEAYRQSPQLLNDIEPALERIVQAIEHKEKIMIFGDYDVDGIMASYIIYTFFTQYLDYTNISIRLPHRTRDGYGIKHHHIDEIHEAGCSLIITVDNGITSVAEAAHAAELGVDMIITDHHQALSEIPQAVAVVNPQVSPQMEFPEICGATVAFKLCMALAERLIDDRKQIQHMYDRLLPFVSMATIADCMPLIHENRLLVKKGFALMNTKRHKIAPALKQFLDYFKIQQIDTYHVGYVIGPRLNATGRIDDAMEGLKSILISHPHKQSLQLEKIDLLNQERKNMQKQMLVEAKQLINPDKTLLVATSESFHTGIVGIVAGRITQQHHKPSLILRVDSYKQIATGSLRGPEGFNIVEMLQTADDLLMRYGGHAAAGGMTIDMGNLDAALEKFHDYADQFSDILTSEPVTKVDTILTLADLQSDVMQQVLSFGPYGEKNPEPLFQLNEVIITRAEEVGRGEKTHLKLHCQKESVSFHIMQRGQGELISSVATNTPLTVIGKIKPDTFNGGFYIDAKWIG